MADILVFVLHHEGAFNKNSLGALSKAAALAGELGGEAHALLIGGDELSDEFAGSLGAYGAKQVFRANGPVGLAQPAVDAIDAVLTAHSERYAIFGGGLLGLETASGLAARRNAGVSVDATEIKVDGGELVVERPIFGDSKVSVAHFRGELGIVVARTNAFEPVETAGASATVSDIEVTYQPYSSQAEVVTRGEQRGADIDIEGADVLIAGGRGLGSAENFSLVEALAGAFGGSAAVAATRAAVDAGWYPYAAQVGQTGKTVSPKLYLAAGISGAIQHKVGMQSSENIVAINKDENAPIFEFSDLGVVGDLQQIVPKLTEAVKAAKGA